MVYSKIRLNNAKWCDLWKDDLLYYAVGTTYFIDYEDYYNPWKIWTEHLHNSVQSDLKRLESQEMLNIYCNCFGR